MSDNTSLFGNAGGNMNPNDILKALGLGNMSMEKIEAQVFDRMIDKLLSILYAEYPETAKHELFYNDPRRSEKEKSVTTLVCKSLPVFVNKLNNNDLDILFEKIQKHKGS